MVDMYMPLVDVPLVELDNRVEQLLNTTPCLEYCRDHGDSKKLAKFDVVERVATTFRLIIHVQRTNHTYVHIYQLCRKIEIALKV